MSKCCWEMCHLFVFSVFFSSLQPAGSSPPGSKCDHRASNITLIFCLLILRGSPSVSSFLIFFATRFFKSHFSCSLNFLKEFLCSELTVEMWSDLKLFQRKGAVEWLIIDILSHLLRASFESCWKCVLDHPVFLHFLLLGSVGPLTKKHTDDLSDSDRTDDEGIFFYPIPPNWFAWQGKSKLTLSPPIFIFFDFLTFLVLFWKWWTFSFCSSLVKLFWHLDVFCPFQLDVKNSCLPSFFDKNT